MDIRRSAGFVRPRRRRGDSGVAAVEFALLLPLLATLLFGIVEYGWIFYQQFNLASAVRDGLRQGVTVSISGSPDPAATAKQRASANLQSVGMDPAQVALQTTYNGSIPTRTLTLSATMTYRKLIGFVPTPTRLQYAMTMMLEMQ